jgi:hypothetical protein
MTDKNASDHQLPRIDRPTGWLISLLTLPVGWFAVLIAVTGGWGILRELLCRAFHENATLLCHVIDWDFRVDTMCLALLVSVVYPLVHCLELRRKPLRLHLYCLAGFFAIAVVIRLIATLIPGKWEAWIG